MKSKVLLGISVIFIVLFTVGVFNVFAADPSGTCGDKVKWALNWDKKTLTISGTGDMYDYDAWSDYDKYAPWRGYHYMTKVTVSKGVTSIGDYTIFEISDLETIVISETVTALGEGFGEYCPNLKSIEVHANNPAFYSEDGVLYSKDKKTLIMYPKNKEDSEYVIPDGVTTITEKAFYGCNKLEKVVMPESVKVIEDSAFSGCSRLSETNIPDGVVSIGAYAFYSCSGLKGITLPSHLESIGDWAFSGCSGLTEIVIPPTLESIGYSAFEKCNGLTEIVIPSTVKNLGKVSFWWCKNLKKVTIEAGCITEMDEYMFSGCASLTEIHIPSDITYIDRNVFNDCYKLAKIYYNGTKEQWDRVTIVSEGNEYVFDAAKIVNNGKIYGVSGTNIIWEIENGILTISGSGDIDYRKCFWKFCAEDFKTAVIKDGITRIGNEAFDGCSKLESVIIPDSVTSIGYSAFDNCDNLKTVYYKGNKEQWGNITVGNFNDTLKNAEIIFSYVGNVLGDINFDGKVTVCDAVMIALYTVNEIELTEKQLIYADVDNDKAITILDAIQTAKISVE